MFNKMCIIGVGLIGGSIAKASRQHNLCQQIVGVGRQLENLQKAVDLSVIDTYSTKINEAVKGADIVVICTPVGSFEKIFTELKKNWSEDCLYTDVGSTKLSVINSLESVFNAIPSNFIPAHPIAGSENNGVEASVENLFRGKQVIITPIEKTTPKAIQTCSLWWQAMGANVSEMSVMHHDEILAATSHLPHILAFSLVELLKNKQDKSETLKYAAGGFKDFTRIASSDPEMWSDICIANASQIQKLLKEFQHQNEMILNLIENLDKQGLFSLFESARKTRNDFLKMQLEQ